MFVSLGYFFSIMYCFLYLKDNNYVKKNVKSKEKAYSLLGYTSDFIYYNGTLCNLFILCVLYNAFTY